MGAVSMKTLRDSGNGTSSQQKIIRGVLLVRDGGVEIIERK